MYSIILRIYRRILHDQTNRCSFVTRNDFKKSSFTSLKTNATAKINTNDENGITSIEIEEIENYLSYIRPSKEIRDQLDIGYRIEKQSVIIF
jgi:regulator of sigma D